MPRTACVVCMYNNACYSKNAFVRLDAVREPEFVSWSILRPDNIGTVPRVPYSKDIYMS